MASLPSLARNYVYNTALTVTNFLFPVVTFPHVLRVIGAEGIGKVTIASTVASYFLALGNFGMGQYGLRQIARDRGDAAALDKTFTELLITGTVTITVSFAAYCVYVLLSGMGSSELSLYAINGLTILLSAASFDWFIQGTENYKFVATRSIAIKIASVIALFIFVRRESDYVLYAFLTVIALSANSLFNISYISKRIQLTFKGIRPFKHIGGMAKFLFVTLALSIYSGLDKVFISAVWGDAWVGYYAPAEKIVRMALSLVVALPSVAYPRMANLFQSGRLDEAKALAGKAIGMCFLLSFPFTVGIGIIGDQAMRLFGGEDFIESILTLRLLAIMILPVSLANVFVFQILFSRGHEGRYSIVVIAELASSALLNSLLVPSLRHNGAAIATVVTEIVGVIILALLSRDMIKGVINYLDLAKITISCLIMSLVLLEGRMLFENSGVSALLSLVSLVMVGGITYCGALIALRHGEAKAFLNRMFH